MSRGSFQSVDRLAAALSDLLSREAVEARAGSGLRVCALQARIQPLVAALARLAGESPGHAFAGIVASLLEKRRQNTLLMQCKLRDMKRALDAGDETLRRIRHVSPVYRRQACVASRLNATT